MKKSRRKSRTANPAKKRHGDSSVHDGRHRRWPRWIGREVQAFFGLPEWLGLLILLLAVGAALAAWRWLTA